MARRLSPLDHEIARLAVPSLGALAAEPLYVLVDTAIVGHLGTEALGGLAIAGTALTAFTWAAGFLSMGTTTAVAQRVGARQPARAGAFAAQAALVAVALGMLGVVLFQVLAVPIAGVLGADGEVEDAAVTYLRLGSLGLPFQLLAFVGHGYWRGTGLVTRSLVVVVVANALNVVLEVLFVYGLDWGIEGSALGTVIAQVVAAVWLAVAVSVHAHAAGTHPTFDGAELRELVASGAKITVRTIALVGVFLLATATAARLGDEQLAAHQIGMQLFVLLALSLDALAVPAQVLTGRSVGRGDPAGARDAVARVVRVGLWVGAGLCAVMALLAPFLPAVFSDDAGVVDEALVVLVLLGVLQLPGSVAFVLDGALLGAGEYGYLQRAMVLAFACALPMFAVVLVWREVGLAGLWGALVAWMALRAWLNARRWRALVPVRPPEEAAPNVRRAQLEGGPW